MSSDFRDHIYQLKLDSLKTKINYFEKNLPQTSNHPSTRLGYLISQTRFTTRRPILDENLSQLFALYIGIYNWGISLVVI